MTISRPVTIGTESTVVTMMNVITVDPANQGRLIELMTEVGEALKDKVPGLISVSLHRSLDGTRLVNYQQWESRDAFEHLQQRYAEQMSPLLEFGTPDAHLYEVVYQVVPT